MMRLFGLIGNPVEHSFSQLYFREKFERESIHNVDYQLFQLDSLESLPVFLETHDLAGFNVTYPFKKDILSYLDFVDDSAKTIGAVNVVKVERRESRSFLKGYNVDYLGFKYALSSLGDFAGQSALILGTGGAAKAVQVALDSLHVASQFVSRSPSSSDILSYQDIQSVINNIDIVVNATPVGMLPDRQKVNFPYLLLSERHLLVDLIYNPERTPFLIGGEDRGCRIMNGLSMLHAQAEESWRIWNL